VLYTDGEDKNVAVTEMLPTDPASGNGVLT